MAKNVRENTDKSWFGHYQTTVTDSRDGIRGEGVGNTPSESRTKAYKDFRERKAEK